MTIDTRHGSPQFPTVVGSISASNQEAMDAAVQMFQSKKDAWVARSIHERITIIDELIH